MSFAPPTYVPDVLGEGFEQHSIAQPNDYEGPVRCTIIRKRNPRAAANRAVLYLHGFTDYFFQRELAEQWLAHGFQFYALDLRKYGRSLLPHQRPNNVRDLREYFPDLDAALDLVRAEGNQTVVLNAHSTGGLIAALYADAGAHRAALAALVLNSPFFEMNLPWLVRRVALPLLTRVGAIFPNLTPRASLGRGYGESLHRQFRGEWDYNLAWKPVEVFPVNAGWLRAIRKGHRQVARGLSVAQPVLVLHSDRTLRRYRPFNDDFFRTDGVLNVQHIRKLAPRLGPRVTVRAIEGGMHDLILSREPVRSEAYRQIFEWLATVLPPVE
ncbi:alpha/beta hydrolase [Hymenobacter sp. BT491]|uniref:alpha/beta hydrolase n=1 Tax=Hymenobacter sp. BT491 TaxID=2766779 RepID=UPI0016537F44|nr:alpha/beta hydrolase [Hymenobacter sp. BT491]MBC6990582.1 alpha/beta hydrolase [Hymenobacter sp. BT491]